jgi:hypothetical protein
MPPFKQMITPEGVGLLKFSFGYPTPEILPFVIKFQPRYRTGVSLLTAVLSTLLLGRDVFSRNDYDRLFDNTVPCENFKKNAMALLRVMCDVWKCTGRFIVSLELHLEGLRLREDGTELGANQQRINMTIDKLFGFKSGILTHDDVLEACSQVTPPADAVNFYNKTPFGAHANQMSAIKSKDGYIAAGRADVAAQDVICVLRDVSIPFILRPIGEKFKLVSPCYVEGLMDGEAWKMVQAGEKSVRTVKVV